MTGQTEPRLVDPAPFVPRQSGPAADADGQAETTTDTGSMLAGRYRLGIRVGSDAAAGAEFWRAEDTVLRRDVAATVLRRFGPGTDPDDDGGASRAQEIIARALRSGSFEHPGCARLLDCSRWRPPPRRRTGTATCWAATIRSGSGSITTVACSSASRCPAPS